MRCPLGVKALRMTPLVWSLGWFPMTAHGLQVRSSTPKVDSVGGRRDTRCRWPLQSPVRSGAASRAISSGWKLPRRLPQVTSPRIPALLRGLALQRIRLEPQEPDATPRGFTTDLK
jgi:hypothetical protein